MIKKSSLEKLVVLKSKLESYLLSLVITNICFYYTILLNAKQVQIQKNLKILLILYCNYLHLLLYILNKDNNKKYVRSKFIQNRTEQQQQQKIKREKEKTAKKDKIKNIIKE